MSESETLGFNARYGNVSFTTKHYPTMEQVANLARAAQLVGIPAEAKVTHLRMSSMGDRVEVEIGWRVD